jgi:hypothetical protein
VRVLGEEPGLGLPNQHTKACPRFQTMHCWCPPATGPGQPHEKDCSHYRRPATVAAYIGSYHDWDLNEADAADAVHYNHALHWLEIRKPESYVHAIVPSIVSNELVPAPAPVFVVKIPSFVVEPTSIVINELELCTCTCTCAAASGVGHASLCPLGEKA